MRVPFLIVATFAAAAASAGAQRVVEVPASDIDVAKPEDLYSLPPGRWHLGRQLWQGSDPCTATQCEAGFTAGALVISGDDVQWRPAIDVNRIIMGGQLIAAAALLLAATVVRSRRHN